MQHFIDIGYHDPTTIYEIHLVKVEEIPAETSMYDIARTLRSKGINNVLIDSPPEGVNVMRSTGLIAQRAIMQKPTEARNGR